MTFIGMKHNKIFLQHILDEMDFIADEVKKLSYETFIESELYTRAFSRSVEIIGEAVKNLSEDSRNSHSQIEWKKLAGMKDKIIHQYFGVDYDLIWGVANNKLPSVKKEIGKIIDSE